MFLVSLPPKIQKILLKNIAEFVDVKNINLKNGSYSTPPRFNSSPLKNFHPKSKGMSSFTIFFQGLN